MFDFDNELAGHYGVFASYQSAAYPSLIEYYGENPAVEMDRLLGAYTTPESCVLDMGCGAGQTLCRLAPSVKEIWGINLEEDLLEAARLRIERLGLTNARLVLGDVRDAEAVKRLPQGRCNLAFSRRGPHFYESLLPTLSQDAFFIQELVSDFDGYPLREIFGRRHYNPSATTDQAVMLSKYAKLGLFPVSCKEYFYEEFFRDGAHLAAFLTQVWAMLGTGYEPERDHLALYLYISYNTTPKGIRVLRQRKIFVFRRAVLTGPFDATPASRL